MTSQWNRRIYRVPVPRLGEPDETRGCEHPDNEPLFFAPDDEKWYDRESREALARSICGACPFVVACGLHGLEHEDHGIWGGLTEQDRRALGGRGVPLGRAPSRLRVVKRLSMSGLKPGDIEALLRQWGRRKRAAERSVA